MKKWRRFFAILLAGVLLSSSVSCQKQVTAENLMETIETGNASEVFLDNSFREKFATVSFSLLKNEYSQSGGNVVISPLGVYYGMAMMANGASGQNKSELQKMLGRHYECNQLNDYMHSFRQNMKNTDYAKLYFENALWYNSEKNAAPNNEFLAVAKTAFGASAYREPFGNAAVTNINHWASNMTDMVEEYVVSDIRTDAPLCMINTTLLDADWAAPVSPENVSDGIFTNAASKEESVQMMASYEQIYLGNDMAEGFIKKYAGENYAFVAIRPKFNTKNALLTTINYLSNGVNYCNLIENRKSRVVDVSMPKFSCSYKGGVASMAQNAGIGTSFSQQYAGLNDIGTCDGKMYVGDLYISTGLSVTEKGTRKGTGAKAGDSSVATNVIKVSLDRPFVFAVVDTKSYMPIILGAINSVKD